MKKRVFHNPVIGDKATLIKTSDETKGEYTLLKVQHLATLATMGGTIPAGIFRLIMPLFRLIASFSQRTLAELIAKYC